jgi:rsbT co-antagonist protein RsbR
VVRVSEKQAVRGSDGSRPEPGSIDLDIADRKSFLNFGDDDVVRLLGIDEMAKRYTEPVIDRFYEHLLSFEEARVFFSDVKVLDRVKLAQTEYFLQLTQGDYENSYIANRLSIGAVHERIGLPIKSYLGMYCFYLSEVARRLTTEIADPAKALETFLSLTKLVFLDIGLAIDSYMLQRTRTIDQQQESIHELQRQTIRELSTPVLQVREGLLILPIVGVIDSQRARELTENLLLAIRANRAKVVVIDITGVASVDSAVANHLVQTVEASRLMGARVIVSGLSAEVAQTLVTIGVDLAKLNTVGDLQGGLEEAEQLLGYRVTRVSQDSDQES